MTLKSGVPYVKATSRSSTARPQEKARGHSGAMRSVEPGIQGFPDVQLRIGNDGIWIASLRSLSSGARSRDPLAPRDDKKDGQCPLWDFLIAASCSGLAA